MTREETIMILNALRELGAEVVALLAEVWPFIPALLALLYLAIWRP